MSTLGTLKSTIADDLNRGDLTSQIASAITAAIEHYQIDPLFIAETRDSTFATVAAQSRYTSSDDADIALWVRLDAVFLEDSGGTRYRLTRNDPVDMEARLDVSASSSRPSDWTYYQRSFWLYPVPDAVYTVRPMGTIKKAAPASDGESDNVWMTTAYQLIRFRAEWDLNSNMIKDAEEAGRLGGYDGTQGLVAMAYDRLKRETSMKTASGIISPTVF